MLAIERVEPTTQRLSNTTDIDHWFSSTTPEIEKIVGRLVAAVRLAGEQPQLGLSYTRPNLLNPVPLLSSQGDVLHVARLVVGRLVIGPGSELTTEQANGVKALLHDEPGDLAARQFTQDAEWLTRWGTTDDERMLGVVLAALAAETSVKQALEQRCPDSMRPLLGAVLDHRNLPLSIHALFDGPAKGALGVSLRESDRRLWSAAGKLFTARNKYVHSLDIQSREEVIEHAETAGALLAWLAVAATQTSVDNVLPG